MSFLRYSRSTLGAFNLAKFRPPPSMLYEGVTFKVGPRGQPGAKGTDVDGYKQINEDMLVPCWYHDALQAIKTKRIQRSTITNVIYIFLYPPRCACKTMLHMRRLTQATLYGYHGYHLPVPMPKHLAEA